MATLHPQVQWHDPNHPITVNPLFDQSSPEMSKATLATTAALIAGLGLSAVSYSINAAPASSGDTALGLYFPINTLNIGGESRREVTLFSSITEMGRIATRLGEGRYLMIFAAKTTASALIALLVAFTFNLDQPQWARAQVGCATE